MPKDELNPDGEENKVPLNQEEDESGDVDLELDDLDEEDDQPNGGGSDDAISVYNAEMQKRGLNYNYKSWDDVAKSAKQQAAEFAKKGMEQNKNDETKDEPKDDKPAAKAPEQPVVQAPSNISERLLRVEEPASKFVIEDIKKSHPGRDVYEVWNESEYYKKEAQARAEAEQAKNRVNKPSNGGEPDPQSDQMSKKFMKNLPPGFKFTDQKK